MAPSPRKLVLTTLIVIIVLGQQVTECNLENEIVKFLGGEVRWTIDHYGIDLIDDASFSSGAATAITAWDASIGSGQEWLDKQGPLYGDVYRKAA